MARKTIPTTVSLELDNYNYLDGCKNKSEVVNNSLRMWRNATTTKEGQIKQLKLKAKELIAEAYKLKQQAEDMEDKDVKA